MRKKPVNKGKRKFLDTLCNYLCCLEADVNNGRYHGNSLGVCYAHLRRDMKKVSKSDIKEMLQDLEDYWDTLEVGKF